MPLSARNFVQRPSGRATFRGVVLPTVELDHSRGLTVEIKHVRIDRELTAEFVPSETPVSHKMPHELLGIALFLAELADERQEFRFQRSMCG